MLDGLLATSQPGSPYAEFSLPGRLISLGRHPSSVAVLGWLAERLDQITEG
jgi:hypothetical protein